MPAPEAVTCPLCGAVVLEKPSRDASDIRALERHFTEACPTSLTA